MENRTELHLHHKVVDVIKFELKSTDIILLKIPKELAEEQIQALEKRWMELLENIGIKNQILVITDNIELSVLEKKEPEVKEEVDRRLHPKPDKEEKQPEILPPDDSIFRAMFFAEIADAMSKVTMLWTRKIPLGDHEYHPAVALLHKAAGRLLKEEYSPQVHSKHQELGRPGS